MLPPISTSPPHISRRKSSYPLLPLDPAFYNVARLSTTSPPRTGSTVCSPALYTCATIYILSLYCSRRPFRRGMRTIHATQEPLHDRAEPKLAIAPRGRSDGIWCRVHTAVSPASAYVYRRIAKLAWIRPRDEEWGRGDCRRRLETYSARCVGMRNREGLVWVCKPQGRLDQT